MKNIQLILIIAILILIYLISMQWFGTETPKEEVPLTEPVYELPATLPPVTTEQASVTEGELPPTTLAPTETEEKDPNLVEYRNNTYGYHLSIPKKMYYAGFGARNGAVHTLAIQPDMLPENFSDATVRVSFYGKKILPELQNAHNNRYEDPNGGYILLLLDDTYSVKIESKDLNGATVKAIEETIGINE